MCHTGLLTACWQAVSTRDTAETTGDVNTNFNMLTHVGGEELIFMLKLIVNLYELNRTSYVYFV